MARRMRITSQNWLGRIREAGGRFHIRVAINLVG